MLADRFGVAAGGEDQIPAQFQAFLTQMSDMGGIAAADNDDLLAGGEKNSSRLDFNPTDLAAAMNKLLGGGGVGRPGEGAWRTEAEDTASSDQEDEEEEDEGTEEDPVTRDYMDRLDAEVGCGVRGREELADPGRPLEVDSGLLANLLASYSAQLDMNGPAASILNTIRINPGQKK